MSFTLQADIASRCARFLAGGREARSSLGTSSTRMVASGKAGQVEPRSHKHFFLKMTFDPEYIRSIALDQHMSSSAADTSSTTTLDTELSKDILDSWRYQSPSHMATLIRNPDPISFHPNPAPHRSKVAEHKSSNRTGEDDIKHRWIGTFSTEVF